MAVDIDAAIVVTKKGTEAIPETAKQFDNLAKSAKEAGEATSWTAQQIEKAQKAAASGAGGGAGAGGFFSPEMIGGLGLAAALTAATVGVAALGAGAALARESVTILFDAAVSGATKGVEAAVEFEKVLTRIRVLSNSSAEDMALYNSEILEMSQAVGKGPQELAVALERITSLGTTGAEAMDILRQSAQLSAVGMGETKTIAAALTAVINSYGKENMSAAQAADILTATVREGGAEADAYAGTLGRIAPLAAQLGIRFADLGANLAAFTRLGVSASEATTGISGFMAALITPTNAGKEALAAYGLTYAKVRQQIQDEGLAQTMVGLMNTFKGNDEALRAFLPNIRALRDQLAVAGSQGEEYIAIQGRIRDSQGDAEAAFNETAKTASFTFAQISAAVESAALKIGQTLLPAVAAVAESIRGELVPILQDLVAWFAKNKDEIQSGMLSVLEVLKNVVAGVRSEFGELKAALESLTGTPVSQWLKEQYDEWLLLDNIMARLSGRESMSDLIAKGAAARNKAYMESQEYADLAARFGTAQPEYQSPGTPTTQAELEAMKAAAKALDDKRAAEERAATAAAAHADAMKAAEAEAKRHAKAVADLVKEMQGLGSGAKDVNAIQEALAQGGGAINASAEFVKKFGKELKEAADAGVPLTEEGQKLVDLYTEQLNADQLNKDLDKAAAEADRLFKASEKAIGAVVKEMQGLGTGRKDIATIEAALTRMGPAGVQSSAAVNKFGKELLEAAESGQELSESAEAVVAAFLNMREANRALEEQKRLIQGLGPSVADLTTKANALVAAIQKAAQGPEGMNRAQVQSAIQQLEQLRQQIQAAGGDTSAVDAQLKALGANRLDRVRDAFGEIAALADRIGQSIGGWGGALAGAVGNAARAVQTYGTAKTGQQKAQAGMAAAGTAFDIYENNKHEMSAGKATMSGAASGAAAGAAFGPYGVVIGAVVGGVIGFFSGSKFRALAKEASGILGTEVSKDLAIKIEKTMKDLKLKDVKSAALLNLDQAITESGKAAATFAPQMKELIKGIADGSIPAKQGMEQLSKSFTMLAEEASKSKAASLALFQVMKQARDSKVLTDEMKASIVAAVESFGSAITKTQGLQIKTEESARAQAEIFAFTWNQTVAEKGIRAAAETLGPALEDLVKRLADGKFAEAAAAILGPIQSQYALATNELFAGASDAAMGFADILKNAINTAMPLTIEQFNAFGTVAADSFEQAKAAALELGMSTEEATRNALLAIAPLLEQQIKASEAYGIPLDENTQKLIEQAKAAGIAFAEDPMTKAADAMERVADALEQVLGLTNSTADGMDRLARSAQNVRIPPNSGGGGGSAPVPGEVPAYDVGGIFRGPSSGSPAMLHGNEAVMTLPQLYGEMAGIVANATAELLGAGARGDGGIVYAPSTHIDEVNIYVNGADTSGGTEEFAEKWRRALDRNEAAVATELDARIDRRVKALAR